MQEGFVLAITTVIGYNSFEIFNTLEKAINAKNRSKKRQDFPILIYSLGKDRSLWENRRCSKQIIELGMRLVEQAKALNNEG